MLIFWLNVKICKNVGYSFWKVVIARERVLHTLWMMDRAMDRVEPYTFLRKPDLTQQAYAGIGKGMSSSYVWVARKPVNAAVFHRHTADRNLMGRTLTDTVITALLSFFLWRCPILLLMAITPVYHPASVNIPLLFPLYYPQKFHINSIWNFYATQNLPNNHYLVCFEN